jgi:hypothetical protein
MRPNAWAEVQDWLGKPQIQQLALNGGEYASRIFIVVFSDGASAPRTIPLAKYWLRLGQVLRQKPTPKCWSKPSSRCLLALLAKLSLFRADRDQHGKQ